MLKGWFPANHLFPQLYLYDMSMADTKAHSGLADRVGLNPGWGDRLQAAGEQSYWLINPRFDSDPLQALKPLVGSELHDMGMKYVFNVPAHSSLDSQSCFPYFTFYLALTEEAYSGDKVPIQHPRHYKISTVNSRLQVSAPLCSNKGGDLKGQNDSTHTIALFLSMFSNWENW